MNDNQPVVALSLVEERYNNPAICSPSTRITSIAVMRSRHRYGAYCTTSPNPLADASRSRYVDDTKFGARSERAYDFEMGFPYNLFNADNVMIQGPEDNSFNQRFGTFDYVVGPRPIPPHEGDLGKLFKEAPGPMMGGTSKQK